MKIKLRIYSSDLELLFKKSTRKNAIFECAKFIIAKELIFQLTGKFMEQKDSFNYRIINESNICIVIFTGVLTNKFQYSFEEFIQQLSKSHAQIFILKFGDVSGLEKSSHRFIVRLQTVIRNDLKATIRICEIKSTWRSELLDTGIIKNKEYYKSLKDALGGSRDA